MDARREPHAATGDREIVLSRIYDAPRDLVFEVCTDPAHLARWFGPTGFTITTSEFDLRPGGMWRFVMHGPDGVDYKNRITFREIDAPNCLRYDQAGEGEHDDITFQTLITFVDRGGRTELTMRSIFPTAAARQHVVEKFGAIEGGQQHLARLAEYLAAGSDHEIVSSRRFDAPRDVVFRAFADPAQLMKWWGPKGFTNTIEALDLRPGGEYRIVMHGPNGTDYPNESVFVEVVEPERIVFDHLEPIHRFRMTILLTEADGGTLMTWRMRFPSADECARIRPIAGPGNEQNFDKLAEHLRTAPPSVVFEITRELAAPRDLVFRMWTEAEHLAKWFGPVGFTTQSLANDPRPGGVFHYHMRAENGAEMWGKWIYREVTPPERLVYVSAFSDPAGATARAPFSENWPLETLSTVTLTERDGKTTLTLRAVPIQATEEERQIFLNMHASMGGGWTGTLEQLTAYLAKQ